MTQRMSGICSPYGQKTGMRLQNTWHRTASVPLSTILFPRTSRKRTKSGIQKNSPSPKKFTGLLLACRCFRECNKKTSLQSSRHAILFKTQRRAFFCQENASVPLWSAWLVSVHQEQFFPFFLAAARQADLISGKL